MNLVFLVLRELAKLKVREVESFTVRDKVTRLVQANMNVKEFTLMST